MPREHEDMYTYVYKRKYLMHKTNKKSNGFYRVSVHETDAS
jgi:hypothetical protein